MRYPAALPVSALAAALVLGPVAQAQVVLPAQTGFARAILVEGEAADLDTVRLLVGLAEIRADLQLGLLSLQEGRAEAGGVHFTHARDVVLPQIAEGLVAAGIADLAPVIDAVAQGGKAGVKETYHAAEEALLRARSRLHPSSGQVLQSVLDLARAAAGKIDPSGQTAVTEYQSAWAVLMVARGELDLLSRDQDRAVARLAGETAMAFDEVILFMPDPGQRGPVAFDQRLILDLLAKLEAVGSEA